MWRRAGGGGIYWPGWNGRGGVPMWKCSIYRSGGCSDIGGGGRGRQEAGTGGLGVVSTCGGGIMKGGGGEGLLVEMEAQMWRSNYSIHWWPCSDVIVPT